MNTVSLEKKKAEIEASFNSLKVEQESHASKYNELQTELIKLQGEYKVITELIDASKEKK